MPPYEIEFAPAAKRQFKKFSQNVEVSLAKRIDVLGQDPRPSDAKKLSVSGRDLWRVREGDYRLVYEIRDDALLVLLIKIGHPREVYRRLTDLR